MAHWRGFRIGEIVVEHRARAHGLSKYGLKRCFHGLADLLTVGFIARYESRPSHLFSIVGVVMSIAGLGICSYLTVLRFMGQQPIGDRPLLLLGVLLLIVGTQFFGMGLIAELVTRRHYVDTLPFTVRSVVRSPGSVVLQSESPSIQSSKEPQ